jgi:hypothetical protein
MNKLKKIASIILCAAVVGALTACSMISVDPEKDANQVVAVVGDKQILKKEYTEQFNYLMSAYGYDETYIKDPGNKETVDSMKKSVLDQMVADEVAYQYAIANGMDLTDAEKQETQDNLNETIESYKDTIREQVEAEASSDPSINVDEETAKRQQEQLAVYQDPSYVEGTIRYQILQKFEESVTSTVNVTEEQAKERYDLEVDNQKLMLDNMASYQLNISLGNTPYVYPEGTKAVKNILIPIPDDKQTEIQTYRQNNNDAQADATLQEELAKIKSQADEVLAKVKAGEDFDSLIDQYGKDPGMTQEPGKTKGYYVYPEDTQYVQSFVDAAVALQNVGDTSDLVASDYGYHILKLIAIPEQIVPFDEIKDDLIATLQSDQEQSALEQKRQELVKAANVKEYYNKL